MNKGELIEAIASAADISKSKAGDALDGVVAAITKAMKKGDKVAIAGFGTFSKTKRKARDGFNPKTQKKIKIKASNAPKFKAAKALKEALN